MSVNELAARRQRNALNRFLAVEDDYWIHDTLPTERLAEVATAGLIGGLDSPSLRILAGQAASSPSADNRELWIRSIEELARVPPEPPGFERAAVRLARAIVAGRIAPERGINVGWNLAAEARGPAGELHDSLYECHTYQDEWSRAWTSAERRAVRNRIVDHFRTALDTWESGHAN